MLLILVVSIPLYICATGSIPLAAILILKGISPGAAFVLLMAGPATNAATITMIGKVLGQRSLFTYLGAIIVGALSFGLLIDYVLPLEWFSQIANQHLGHNHGEQLSWWHISSGVILFVLIVNGYIQKYWNNNKLSKNKIMAAQTIKVEGMTCNHCKTNIETNLEKLDFVNNAKVDLATKTVVLEGENVDVEKTKATITSLGYKPV